MTTLYARRSTNTIIRTPFNPAGFIGSGWDFWRGPADGNGLEGDLEQDNLSLALPEVDTSKILLETRLKGDESYITGEECIKRLIVANRIRIDLGFFQTLWDNQALMPRSFSERVNGNFQLIFVDQPLRSPFGDRYTLYFYHQSDGGWGWDVYGLSYSRHVLSPSAVLAQ